MPRDWAVSGPFDRETELRMTLDATILSNNENDNEGYPMTVLSKQWTDDEIKTAWIKGETRPYPIFPSGYRRSRISLST